MTVIRTLLIILEAACCLALIGLVLLQKSKSDGLGSAFGGGGNDSLFGARAGNVLTKATIIIGCIFLANTLVLGMLFSGSAGAPKSAMADKLLKTPSPPVETQMLDVPAPSEIPIPTAE